MHTLLSAAFNRATSLFGRIVLHDDEVKIPNRRAVSKAVRIVFIPLSPDFNAGHHGRRAPRRHVHALVSAQHGRVVNGV
jgi:hypothetical protein